MNLKALNLLFEFVHAITNRHDSFPVKILRDEAHYFHVQGCPTDYFRFPFHRKPCDFISKKWRIFKNELIKCGNFVNNPSLTTTYFCLDFDDHQNNFDNNSFNSTIAKLHSLSLLPVVIPTATGKGCHVFCLFDRAVDTPTVARILKSNCVQPNVDLFPKGSSEYGGNIWYPHHFNLQPEKKAQILDYFGSIIALPRANPYKFLRLDLRVNEDTSFFYLCKTPDISYSVLLKIKQICQTIDLRWIYQENFVNFPQPTGQDIMCRDIRSATGDRNPSMLVTTDKEHRGNCMCFRDNTIFDPIRYMVHFRKFTINSAMRYLHKFWKVPYDSKIAQDDRGNLPAR